jgi:cardiolipin synthase
VANKKTFILRLAGLLILWGSAGVARAREAEYVPERAYLDTVIREIKKARESVTVGMYMFTLRSPGGGAHRLAQALAEAHRAGIKVEVLLDQNIEFVDGEAGEGKNGAAYAFLQSQGVPVYFDDGATFAHGKVVVIDGEVVITGSSNWSEAALTRNHEANVLIRSKDVAREALAALRAIPRQAPMADMATVEIPGEFVQDPKYLGRMANRGDERAFDVYLYLLKQGTATATVDYDDLAGSLGLAMDPNAGRRQINKVLKKLKGYGLIRATTTYGKDAEVALNPLGDRRPARVPVAYWKMGWDRRLGLAAKWFMVVGAFEGDVSTLRPRWSAAEKTLARRYHVSAWFISRGVMELRRWNLLEVGYGTLPEGGPRLPSLYTPNEFYDPGWAEKKLEDLKRRYGEEKLARARRAAGAVYEDWDLAGVEELIKLEEQFGVGRVEAGVRVVEGKRGDNPDRNLGYLIGTIRNLKVGPVEGVPGR